MQLQLPYFPKDARMISDCFGVSEDSVHRYYNKFREQGETGFFGDDARHGKAHKIVGQRRLRIQQKLDKGQSVYSIAKEEGVRESAIRYQVKQGNLKKSHSSTNPKSGCCYSQCTQSIRSIGPFRHSHYSLRRTNSVFFGAECTCPGSI